MAETSEPTETTEATTATATQSTAPASPGERALNQLKGDQTTAVPADPVAKDGAPEADATEQTSPPTFVQQLEAMGFHGVTDEEEAKQRVLEALRQEKLRAEEATRRAQELQRLRELEAQQAAAPSQAATDTAPNNEQPARPWQLPKLDHEQLERYQTVSTDPTTGKKVVDWIEGTPPELKAKYAEYKRAAEEWTNTIVHKPHEFIAALKEELLAEMPEVFEQRLQQKTIEQQTQQFLETFKTENAGWLYKTDPVTKQPVGFSEEGLKFQQTLEDLHAKGISNPKDAIALAMQLREAERAKALAAVAQQHTPSEVAEQKKRDFLLRAAQSPPSQGGSRPTLTDGQQRPQNPALSPGQKFLQVVKERGVALHP